MWTLSEYGGPASRLNWCHPGPLWFASSLQAFPDRFLQVCWKMQKATRKGNLSGHTLFLKDLQKAASKDLQILHTQPVLQVWRSLLLQAQHCWISQHTSHFHSTPDQSWWTGAIDQITSKRNIGAEKHQQVWSLWLCCHIQHQLKDTHQQEAQTWLSNCSHGKRKEHTQWRLPECFFA